MESYKVSGSHFERMEFEVFIEKALEDHEKKAVATPERATAAQPPCQVNKKVRTSKKRG